MLQYFTQYPSKENRMDCVAEDTAVRRGRSRSRGPPRPGRASPASAPARRPCPPPDPPSPSSSLCASRRTQRTRTSPLAVWWCNIRSCPVWMVQHARNCPCRFQAGTEFSSRSDMLMLPGICVVLQGLLDQLCDFCHFHHSDVRTPQNLYSDKQSL